MLQRHAGLWITWHKDVMYSQATQINFICPMRFDDFPLDTQVQCSLLGLRYNFDIWTSDVPCISLNLIYQICKFQVGSYSYDMSKMAFDQTDKVQG